MKQVIVIGAGAAGLISSIYASRKGYQVTVLERNASCGKKLLLTGNSHCNYWNSDQDLIHYYSKERHLLDKIITVENQNEVLSFFDRIGIIPKIKNGYYYPSSYQAATMKESLEKEACLSGVQFRFSFLVDQVIKTSSGFIVTSKEASLSCDYLILATGSKSFPKTGSDGLGYEMASSLGHSLVPVLPSLVQLEGHVSCLKEWEGVRSDVKVSLYEDDRLLRTEKGEIQLTSYGLSGICIFNLSGLVAKGLNEGKTEKIFIDFVPWLNMKDISSLILWLENRNRLVSGRTTKELLEGFLNYKLVSALLKEAKIKGSFSFDKLEAKQKESLATLMLSFPFSVIKTKSFDHAQVCSGGIALSDINLKTMASKKVENLYFAGEIVDVDGDCGGYNLSFAWISGMLAGRSIGVNYD